MAAELHRLAAKLRENEVREVAERRRFIEGYSELAAAGQAAMGLSRAVHASIGRIFVELDSIRGALGLRPGRIATKSFRELESATKAIEKRISMLAPIETGERRRRRAIDVPAELSRFGGLMDPLLSPSGIRLQTNTSRKGVLRIEMRPETLHRILHILTMNSVEWLHRIRRPEIKITVRALADHCEILFSDNGPGISRSSQRKSSSRFSLDEKMAVVWASQSPGTS